MKKILALMAIVCMASVLTGCCCCGPCGYTYPSCGYNGCGGCDSCGTCDSCAPCDSCSPCGACNACEPCGCYGPVCPPNYCGGCCFTGCYPCCPIMTIVSIPFRLVEGIWMCAAGHWPCTGCCGPIYCGECSEPVCCDPCCFNTYTGPCSSRCCGATACCGTSGCSGCSTCGGNAGYSEMDGGEVIMDSAAPAPTTAPSNPSIIQPTPAPATTTYNNRNYQNRQAQASHPTTYKAAKASNGNIQQVQYQQPVQKQPVQYQQPAQKQPVQKTYASAPKAQQKVNVPDDVLKQLPPGAVIVSDEVVSSQGTVNAGGDAYAPVLTANQTANQVTTNKIVTEQTTTRSASQNTSGWKSAAVNRTQR